MTIIARSALLTTAALLIAGCGNEGTTDDSGSTASVGGSNASANSSTTGGNKASTTKSATSNATKAAGGTSSVDTEDSGQGGATSEETGSEGGSASTDPVDAQGGSTAEETAAGGTTSGRTTRTSKASGGSSSSSASTTKATGGATSNTVSTKSTGGASTATTTRAVGGASTSTTTAPTTSNLEKFSFFVTSYAAMVKLSGNNQGFGGKLDYDGSTGIDGADKICAAIAEISMPGAGAKGWKAFLSTSTVNAIDRITYEGPFYDRRGRQVASSKSGLIATRPTGADSAIANDLPNENGTPNHNPDGTQVDNHDVLTGSNAQGKATGYLCDDWKDNTKTGQIQIGHSWPAHGDNWITAHTVSGCKPGVTFLNNPNAEGGPQGTVGSMGGYGAIYCLASQP